MVHLILRFALVKMGRFHGCWWGAAPWESQNDSWFRGSADASQFARLASGAADRFAGLGLGALDGGGGCATEVDLGGRGGFDLPGLLPEGRRDVRHEALHLIDHLRTHHPWVVREDGQVL